MPWILLACHSSIAPQVTLVLEEGQDWHVSVLSSRCGALLSIEHFQAGLPQYILNLTIKTDTSSSWIG
jgi:hypothetical protein